MLANGGPGEPYYHFYEYVSRSPKFYDGGPQEIIGLQAGANYTILIPTEAAMKKAVEDGFLPGTLTPGGAWASFTHNPGNEADSELV